MKIRHIFMLLVVCLLLTGCRQIENPVKTTPNETMDSTEESSSAPTGAVLEPGVGENIFQNDPTTAPTEAPTEPTATTAPTEPSTAPSEPSTAPTEPTTQPTTAPTEPTTQPTTAPTEPTTQPTEPTTEPTAPSTEPTNPGLSGDLVAQYEAFEALSGSEQMAYMQSFSSVEAFFAWYNAAKAAYEEANPSIEIGGDGSVDLDQIVGGK